MMVIICGLIIFMQANEATTFIHLKADRERVLEENQKNLDKINLLEQKLADLEESKFIYSQYSF